MQFRVLTAALLCPALLFLCTVGTAPVKAAAPPGISSLSAVIYEPDSGRVLYDKDGATRRPMASTTKLMTALLAAERLAPERTVTVPAAALPVEGTQIGLAPEDTVTVRDLLAGLLLESGNDAANALALLMADSMEDFAAMMNGKAAELGMSHSLFVTPSGLDAGEHGASARDMAVLGAAVLEHPLLAQLCAAKSTTATVGGRTVTFRNHNKLLRLLEGCVGLKTGFTKKSGRCLVSAAQRDGVTLIVATLNGGDYWNDHIALYDYGFSLVHSEPLPTVAPSACPVAGGTAPQVPLTTAPPPACVLLEGERVSVHVELPRFLWAAVEQGQPVGLVRYTAGERELCTLPILAAQTVPTRQLPPWRVLWWQRFLQLTDSLLQ